MAAAVVGPGSGDVYPSVSEFFVERQSPELRYGVGMSTWTVTSSWLVADLLDRPFWPGPDLRAPSRCPRVGSVGTWSSSRLTLTPQGPPPPPRQVLPLTR